MNIFDLHNDIVTSGITEQEIILYKREAQKSGTEFISAIWTSKLSCLDYLKKCEFLTDNNFMTAIEDCGILSRDFQLICAAAPLYCSLTWNYKNELAGGALSDGELTECGKTAIEFLNNHNIALDLSHLNEKSFFQAIDVADNVLASHSCLSAIHSHLRNLTDRQVEKIVDKNGIVGIAFVEDFLGGDKDLKSVVCQINYFIGKFGCDNISIGTDFFGTQPIPGLDDYGKLRDMKDELLIAGLTSDQIEKIFNTNAKKFFKRRLEKC